MRISDWSSDVCSSDLLHILRQQASAAIMDPGAIDEERGVIKGEERLRNSPAAIVGVKQLEILAAGTLLPRSEEHTSELQSLMRISYAVFCLKKKHTDYTDH